MVKKKHLIVSGCYQELVSTNIKLQYKLNRIKRAVETKTLGEAHNEIIRIVGKI